MRSLVVALLAISLSGPAMAQGGQGQPWPSKPIKVVVPFGAGSATDILPRMVMEQVAAQIGQPICVGPPPAQVRAFWDDIAKPGYLKMIAEVKPGAPVFKSSR